MEVSRQLNVFAGSIKGQRSGKSKWTEVREAAAEYVTDVVLFDKADLGWLQPI
jgi:hypothetical protein